MVIKKGITSNEVKLVQKQLGVKTTGFFGDTTDKRLRQFQKEHNLNPDGILIWGSGDTYNALFKQSVVQDSTQIIQPVINNQDNLLNNVSLPLPIKNEISSLFERFNVKKTKNRLVHFLAQCAEESRNFTVFSENLYYSEKGLLENFDKYFTPATAKKYAKKPIEIANIVYANRMGNGSVESGDGYTYRGRGAIQLTGKTNYTKFSEFVGEDCVSKPALVSDKYPITSAFFYFNSNKIWDICDLGATYDVVKKVTKKVNGGYTNLDKRYNYFTKFYKEIS